MEEIKFTNIKFTTIIVSCLIKHQRFEYLKETILGIKKMFGESCDEIIVLFDKIGIDKMVGVNKCITHNCGLGYSFNEGIRQAKNELILQIEDDWIPNPIFKSFEQGIHNMAYNILKSKKGIVRLYPDPIHSKPDPNINGWILGVKIWNNPCFHLELVKPKKEELNKHWLFSYYYTNAPQFKLKSFVDDIGYYKENCSPPEVESDISKKFMFSEIDYKVFFICDMFVINGNDSIRDNDYKLDYTKNNKYNYEQIISLGNHHLTGKILKIARGEYDKYPFDRTFLTTEFLKDLFNNENMDFFREIINMEKQHYGDKINYISFPEKNLKKIEDKNYYLSCINNLGSVLQNNASINFIYSTYKLENDDLNPNSEKTKNIIEELEVIQNKIKNNYKCNKIGMTIITFEENEMYDNDNIEYNIEKIMEKQDFNKVIIKCKEITNTNWLYILEKNPNTIYKLYCDLYLV
jgi:hypothetical protein